MKINYPERIPMANTPTPIQKLETLSRELGIEFYAKRDDMTGMELSGNKVRKLEFLMAEAMQKGADTVVTCGGVQSNHCRATAAACVKLGLKCHLILRTRTPKPPYDGNHLLDYLFGADFTYMDKPEYYEKEEGGFEEVLEGIRAKGGKPFYIPVGGSVAMGSWGYVKAFEEITGQLDAMGIKKAHLVVSTGSGGTHSGLILGRALTKRTEFRITGVIVCDDIEYFQGQNRKILGDAVKLFNLPPEIEHEKIDLIDGYIGPGYALPYPELMETIKMAALKEAIILDPVYTGKAFHGLIMEIRKGKFPKESPVVFIHTGGAFGLFPQKDVFEF
ncbi:D-cysteine desulfhydrase family protein [Candidatus Sumerlaeota bacterium]|nr:D-cysteine desulfhydrase family protein [Candidatus Sumerlaeota bacterium]